MENTINIEELARPKSINEYRERFPDATMQRLVEIQSNAMSAHNRRFLARVATGSGVSIEEEIAKSMIRNI